MRIGDKLILIRRIFCFLETAKEGAVSKAALKHGLKQSNMSAAIRELEDKTKCRLLTRTSRGMVMTDAGKKVYEIACNIDKAVCDVDELSLAKFNLSGSIRLWTSDALAAAYLSACLPGFYQLYPDVHIDIICSIDSPNVLYEVDLALVFEEPRQSSAVVLMKHDLKFGLFASMDYLSHNGYPKNLTDLQENHKLCVRDNFSAVWEEWKNLQDGCRHIVASTNSSSMLMQLTRDGIGVALHPMSIGLKEQGLVYLDKLDFTLSHPFWIVSHIDAKDQPKIRALINYVREATSQL